MRDRRRRGTKALPPRRSSHDWEWVGKMEIHLWRRKHVFVTGQKRKVDAYHRRGYNCCVDAEGMLILGETGDKVTC